MVLAVVGPKMAMDFGSKEVEPRLRRGLSTDSPRTIFGTVKKHSRFAWLDQKRPCVICIKFC